MNAGAWSGNWAWSLPLIVLNVVVHVIGLGLINKSVVRVLSGAGERRRFMPTFALVMGVAALLATVLHGIEAATRPLPRRPIPQPLHHGLTADDGQVVRV
jgi:xanthine/uracil permease